MVRHQTQNLGENHKKGVFARAKLFYEASA